VVNTGVCSWPEASNYATRRFGPGVHAISPGGVSPRCLTGRSCERSQTDPFHRRSTASSRRIGSQELLACRDRWRFAQRANPPELRARPRGFPLRNLTPLRCGGGRVHRTTQWRRSQGANAASPSPQNRSHSRATANAPYTVALRTPVNLRAGQPAPRQRQPHRLPHDHHPSPHTSCTELAEGVDRGRHSPV